MSWLAIIVLAAAISVGVGNAYLEHKSGTKLVDAVISGFDLSVALGSLVGVLVLANFVPELPGKWGAGQFMFSLVAALFVAYIVTTCVHFMLYWSAKLVGLEPTIRHILKEKPNAQQ